MGYETTTPYKNFKWLTEDEINSMLENYQKTKECTLEVDLEYTKELYDDHNDYPLAPKSIDVNKVKKLIPNLNDKKDYVVHHATLQLYLKHGLKLKKFIVELNIKKKHF